MVLASRGTRDFDDGEEPVEDEERRNRLRRRARQIHLRALLSAALLTIPLLLI